MSNKVSYLRVVPKCPKCNSSENIECLVADAILSTGDKVWFTIDYCRECSEVVSCCFQGMTYVKKNREMFKKRKLIE